MIERSLRSLLRGGLCSIHQGDLEKQKTKNDFVFFKINDGKMNLGGGDLTVEDESGFADATRAMENEGLRDTVVLSVVVEDCL